MLNSSTKSAKLILCLFLITFLGCKKNEVSESTYQLPNLKSQAPGMKIAQEIPPEILVSMYNDYLKENQTQKADNLKKAYDFETGKVRSRNDMQATSNSYVPGVGYVVDGGYFVQGSSLCQAHVEKLGWVTYSFNDMNLPWAPNAFDNTAPSSGQYMGTVNQSKRIEAFVLPYIYYTFDGITNSGLILFQYRAFMQNNGWLPWVNATSVAGITGQSLRLEAFEITVGPTYVSFPCQCVYQPKVYYRAQVQAIGWQPWVGSGQLAGTTGQSKRVEAMQVRVYFIE